MQAGDQGESTILSEITDDNTNRFTRMHLQDTNMPSMTPCPPFGWHTTNFVESDNNTILVNGVRDATPLEAIKIY